MLGYGSVQIFEYISTWFSLYDQIFDVIFDVVTPPDVLPPTVSVDAPASEYQMPDQERWNVTNNTSIPILLDGVCRTIGQRLVRQLGGTIQIQNFKTAYDNDNSYWQQFQYLVIAGGRLSYTDLAYALPNSVAVGFSSFNTFESESLGGWHVEVTQLWPDLLGDEGNSPVIGSLLPTMFAGHGRGIGAPWQAQIFADKTAAFADLGGEDNYSWRAAADYYQWACAITDCTMKTIVNRPITGLDMAIEWVVTENECLTRVIRTPFSDLNLYGSPGTGPVQQLTVMTKLCTTYSNGVTSLTNQFQEIQLPAGTILGSIFCTPALPVGCCVSPSPTFCLTDTLGNQIPLYFTQAYGYNGQVYSSNVPGSPGSLGTWVFVLQEQPTLNFDGGGPGNIYGYCWSNGTNFTQNMDGSYSFTFTNNDPDSCLMPSGTVTITEGQCVPPSPPPPPPPVTSWNCVDGTCTQIIGNTGTFSTIALCVASGCATSPPPLTSYNCVLNQCLQISGTSGEYSTLALCETDCGQTSYNCIDNNCIAVMGSGGEYSTLVECQGPCECSNIIITQGGGSSSSSSGTTSIPGVSAAAGQLLLISAHAAGIAGPKLETLSATYGGITLGLPVVAAPYASANGSSYVFTYVVPSDTTGDIVVSLPHPVTGNITQVSVLLVSGLPDNTVDVSGVNNGTGGTPTAGTTPSSDPSCKLNLAIVTQRSFSGATSSLGFVAPVESDGQDQSGNDSGLVYGTIQTGYHVDKTAGAFTGTAGGSTTADWTEIVLRLK